MPACHDSGVRLAAYHSTNTVEFVGSNGHAHASPTNKDPTVKAPGKDRFTYFLCDARVVGAFFGEGAKVFVWNHAAIQISFQCFFERDSSMVTANSNFHRLPLFVMIKYCLCFFIDYTYFSQFDPGGL